MQYEEKLIIDAELADNRAELLRLREKKKVRVSPFVLAATFFFSALITVIIMLFIVIFLVLKDGFSQLSMII